MRLKEKYKKEAIPVIMEKIGHKSVMAAPRFVKAVVNVGFGRMVTGKTNDEQKKIYESILEDITLICGQRAVLTKAKKSISTFKLREGMFIGAKVTLRGEKMYNFLERLINIALPRSRDFKGISNNAVDQRGNLTIGIKEHIIFPEVAPEKSKSIFGFETTIVINAKNKEKGVEFFKAMGFPMKKDNK
jgi:large subunit ribosomal protein L5